MISKQYLRVLNKPKLDAQLSAWTLVRSNLSKKLQISNSTKNQHSKAKNKNKNRNKKKLSLTNSSWNAYEQNPPRKQNPRKQPKQNDIR